MAQTLDLREANTYVDAVYWIRERVVLGKASLGPVLELDVLTKDGKIVLFMNPANHYIMAFRGADKIYLLKDKESAKFESDFRKTYAKEKIEPLDLSVSHSTMGLDTFGQTRKSRKAADFRMGELRHAMDLARFSSKGDSTYATLKRPLSMLVFMIAEAARMPMLENDFKNMYFGHSVFVDDAVQSYDTAKLIKEVAVRAFDKYPVKAAVEKLGKRCAEMEDLLRAIQKAATSRKREALILDVLEGRAFPGSQTVTQQTARFKQMCGELSLTKADRVAAVMSAAWDTTAMRAAGENAVTPALGF